MNGPQPVEVDEAAVATSLPIAGDPPGAIPGAGPVDGRSARSAKTRDAIADAVLDLLAEGSFRPTAREIAQRAGVSVRSVYVHFDDLEDLFCVAADRHFARIAPMLTPVPATGPLAERAHALVQQRVRIYAKVGAVGRATRLHAESSPTLARILREARSRSRIDIERVFAAELRTMTPTERGNAVAVVDALTSADAWQTLREHHELDVDTALRCVADAIVVHLRERTR